MVEENRGVLDEGTWQIVYSFFHPEEESSVGGIGSLLSGLLSEPIGVASGVSLPGAIATSRFYSGSPACLVWSADDDVGQKNYWRAQIMVMSGIGFDESVVVSVTDSQGEGIESATLILLNSTLEVLDGTAAYSLAEFQRNLANTNVALVYPDGRRVPGGFRLDVMV